MKGIVFCVFLIFAISTLSIGQVLQQADIERNTTRNIYELTNNLSWTYNQTLLAMDAMNSSAPDFITRIHSTRLSNIIYKLTNAIGFSFFEVMKTGIEFGYDHPEYDYKFIFKIVQWYLIVLIIVALIPLVIPLLALITLAFIGLKRLLLRRKSS